MTSPAPKNEKKKKALNAVRTDHRASIALQGTIQSSLLGHIFHLHIHTVLLTASYLPLIIIITQLGARRWDMLQIGMSRSALDYFSCPLPYASPLTSCS